MSNPEDVVNLSGNEHTDQIQPAKYLLQKHIYFIKRDDGKTECRAIYEVIYNN